MITYGDFYNYITSAKRNEGGVAFPFEDGWLAVHIYDNRCQANIIRKSDEISLLNLIFDPNEHSVKIVIVNNGVAEYENGISIPMSTAINQTTLPDYSVQNFIYSVASAALNASRITREFDDFTELLHKGATKRFRIGNRTYKMKAISDTDIKVEAYDGSTDELGKINSFECKSLQEAMFCILSEYC